MSGCTYYDAQSEDQATYLEMMTLIDARETAREKLRAAWMYARAMTLADPAGSRRRVDEASADYVATSRRAKNIRWNAVVRGWYYRD